MPSVPPVTVDDDGDAELDGPWVSVAVPTAMPTSEVDGDAPFGGGGAAVAAASPCRLEEERLVGTCRNCGLTLRYEKRGVAAVVVLAPQNVFFQ